MNELLNALFHGAAYAFVGGAMLVVAYFVLDGLTPGHLGRVLDTSRSAGLVTSAWLLSTAAVVFTAIWTNGETSLGWALGWTVAFSLVGLGLNTVLFLIIEAVTPGSLKEAVCAARITPLAMVATGVALSSALVVCASIA